MRTLRNSPSITGIIDAEVGVGMVRFTASVQPFTYRLMIPHYKALGRPDFEIFKSSLCSV